MLSNTKYISPVKYKEVETVFKQDNTMKDCTSSGVTSGGISYDINSKPIVRGVPKEDEGCSSCNKTDTIGEIVTNDEIDTVKENHLISFISTLFGFAKNNKNDKKMKPISQNSSDYAVNKK